jgi:hypothetical protein
VPLPFSVETSSLRWMSRHSFGVEAACWEAVCSVEPLLIITTTVMAAAIAAAPMPAIAGESLRLPCPCPFDAASGMLAPDR